LLDCCHAGALNTEGLNINLDDIQKVVASQGRGVTLIAATEENNLAKESYTLKQGVFSHWLFNGLIGDASNRNGEVTTHSLHEYISRNMAEHHKSQKVIYKTTTAGEPPIIGKGFKPQETIVSSKLTEADLQVIYNTTSDKLDGLEEKTKVDTNLWIQSVHKETGSELSELIEWRNKLERSHPDLKTSPSFRRYDSKITKLQINLADIQPQTVVSEGIMVEEIGSGGFGNVYKIQTSNGFRAYKLYHATLLHEKERVKAFYRGYNAMKKLQHPNIVQVGQLTQAPLGFYMDYIEGQNFANWWTDDPTKYLEVLLVISQTLNYAHTRPDHIVHRDIKPQNIIVDDTNPKKIKPYLTDFDLAWYSMSTTFSTVGDKAVAAFGHYLYAAPEQYEAANDQAKRNPITDIYGFGQLCYFAVVGKDPAHDKSISIGNLRECLAKWTNALAANEFLKIYEKSTQRTPSHRYPTMSEIGIALVKTRNLLLDPNSDHLISRDEFVSQIVFSIYGFEIEPKDSFMSKSERTQVEIQAVTKEKTFIKFDVISGVLGLTGSFDVQRAAVNRRIDKVLSDFRTKNKIEILRHQERVVDVYSSKLEITGDYLSLNGALICGEIIQHTIRAIES
jgi:serine/threonine protein kinase